MEKYDADVQKKLYTDYLDLLVGYNMNAVFFQIRGMADAFYESEYEPWSKYITGSAGVRPDYDVGETGFTTFSFRQFYVNSSAL